MKVGRGARRALNRFEEAIRNHEMMGSMHPNTHESVEAEYKRAKELLEKYLTAAVEVLEIGDQ